jgi:hypothetical protein
MMYMKQRAFYLVFVLFIISCSHAPRKKAAKHNPKSNTAKAAPKFIKQADTLAIPDDTVPKVTIPEGTIQVGESMSDTSGKVRVLQEELYDPGDDVTMKDAELQWQGLFHNKGNFFIKPTRIKFTKDFSAFDNDPDKPDQKTGLLMKCLSKDSCWFVFRGIDSLVSGPVKTVDFRQFIIYAAGQKKEFKFGGVTYTFYTTGSKRNGQIYNFKLFLLANVKGHYYNQLIRSFGDTVPLVGSDDPDNISIDFVGDLDGDNIPDFITSVSGYAFGSTSLYLSRPAGNRAIVVLTGYMASYD